MDREKIGNLIRTLRKEKGMTQLQLAEKLHVGDRAVSKWETGAGCPDISIAKEIAEFFGIDLEMFLSGEIERNDDMGGNMKNIKFYVCPTCGNVLTSTGGAAVSCCGNRLTALEAHKAEEGRTLDIEKIDNDYFISSSHEMTKQHYISFVAMVISDKLLLVKTYPEWDLSLRLPNMGHGLLFWFCNVHGLSYRLF